MHLKRQLRLEPLEERSLLATVGAPWPQPRDLTLSFAPDGTPIGLHESNLFATLGRQRAASAWQTEVLRAFQLWTAAADLDIGIVPDTGRPFGVAGLAQGDPRFGDIRLGAFPQSGVIANVAPYQPVAGSWSGDMFLNSSLASELQSSSIDLFSVLLNEAGNALGLADNDDPESVMYTDYRGQRDALSPADVTAIQELYGSRHPDTNEGDAGNDTAVTATPISPALVDGTVQATVEGDLHHAADVDYYRVSATAGPGRMTVRLIAAGESLLVGSLDVTRVDGTSLASAAAVSPLANNIEVLVPVTQAHGNLVIRVGAGENVDFAIGRYRLEVSFRSADSLAPTEPAPAPHALVPGGNVLVFAQPRSYPALVGFVDEEQGQNDSISTATPLQTPFGYVAQTRYEAIGAIRALDDVDLYRIQAPFAGDRRVMVHLDTFDVRLLDFQIGLYDEHGSLIAESSVPQADGRVALDVADMVGGQVYYLRVASGSAGGSGVGNYVVIADFVHSDSQLVELAAGSFAILEQQDARLWHSTRTRLYRFDVRPESAMTQAAVRFEIVTSDGATLSSVVAPSGVVSTQFIWLPAGSFTFTLRPEVAVAGEFQSISYVLLAAAISDDIGPGLVDPTESLLPGDADRSGVVDRGDIAAVAADYGAFPDLLPSAADLDGDGDVDLADLIAVVANLGRMLLPDLSASTSSGSESASTPAAPSAIVRASRRSSTIEIAADSYAAYASRPVATSTVATRTVAASRRLRPESTDAVLSATESSTSISGLIAEPTSRGQRYCRLPVF